jgi:hypothetical protein
VALVTYGAGNHVLELVIRGLPLRDPPGPDLLVEQGVVRCKSPPPGTGKAWR